MEKFTDEVRTFAGLFVAQFPEGDLEAATTALGQLNKLLAENPSLLPFIANPNNQATMKEMVEVLENFKGSNPIVLMPKIINIAKKFS